MDINKKKKKQNDNNENKNNNIGNINTKKEEATHV